MSAVRCSECVVYEYIRKRSKLLAECFNVLCFLCSEACVFKKNNVAVLHLCNSLPRIFADNIVISGKNNLLAKLFRKSFCNGCKRKFFFRLTLGLAHMRAKDNLCALVNKVFDSRHCAHDSVFVRYISVSVKRHVKIATHQNALAGNVNVLNSFFVHRHCESPHKKIFY